MAHFAKLDESNTVTQVIVIDNDSALTEQAGKDYIASIGLEGNWLQTSYNTLGGEHLLGGIPFRKNYAGIGMTYDQTKNAFIPQKPSEGDWILNEETCRWEKIV